MKTHLRVRLLFSTETACGRAVFGPSHGRTAIFGRILLTSKPEEVDCIPCKQTMEGGYA